MTEVGRHAYPCGVTDVEDRAGKAYWDALWVDEGVDGAEPLLTHHVERQFAAFFADMFAPFDSATARLLEVGCANSRWLPFFAETFGLDITGLDYSAVGCEQERELLARARVEGTIVCADMFQPPRELRGAFDMVLSLGVVEHFEDTAGAIAALAEFLAPGGRLITIVPNLRGAIGIVQRLLNRRIYSIHLRLGPDDLVAGHCTSDFVNAHADYFSTSNFGVLNLRGLDPGARTTRAKELVVRGLIWFSRSIWAIERRVPLRPSRLLSGYVVCVADRAAGPCWSAAGDC
jgi:SAM-dependent methyltransferase